VIGDVRLVIGESVGRISECCKLEGRMAWDGVDIVVKLFCFALS
jgi:hypothetical protein